MPLPGLSAYGRYFAGAGRACARCGEKCEVPDANYERYCEIKDDATLQAVVQHWAKILKIADWDIESHLVPQAELEETQVACNSTDLRRRDVQILLLNAETRLELWKAGGGLKIYGKQTMECDVLHELLHIWTKQCGLNNLERGSREYLAMEQMTEALAQAFVGLHSYFSLFPHRPPDAKDE